MKILFLMLCLWQVSEALADVESPSCRQYLFEHASSDSDLAVSELINRHLYSKPLYEFYPVYSLKTTELTRGKNLKDLQDIYLNINGMLSENYQQILQINKLIDSGFQSVSDDPIYLQYEKMMQNRSLFLKHMIELIWSILKKYGHQVIPIEIHKNYVDENYKLVIGNQDRILSFVILPGNTDPRDYVVSSFQNQEIHKKTLIVLVPTLNRYKYLPTENILYVDLKTMLEPDQLKPLLRSLKLRSEL